MGIYYRGAVQCRSRYSRLVRSSDRPWQCMVFKRRRKGDDETEGYTEAEVYGYATGSRHIYEFSAHLYAQGPKSSHGKNSESSSKTPSFISGTNRSPKSN